MNLPDPKNLQSITFSSRVEVGNGGADGVKKRRPSASEFGKHLRIWKAILLTGEIPGEIARAIEMTK